MIRRMTLALVLLLITPLSIIAVLLMTLEAKSQPFAPVDEDWPDLIDEDDQSRSRCQVSTVARRTVMAATADKLNRLINADDHSLSLAAAWERVRRGSRIDGVASFHAPLDKSSTLRFVGLVEGRIKMPIPSGWEKSVLSGAWNNKEAISFRYFLDAEEMLSDESNETSSAVLEEHIWKVTLGNRQVGIPESCISRGNDWEVTHVIEEEATYFVLHNGRLGGRGFLHRLENHRQIPKWRTTVLCTTGEMTYTGGDSPVRMWISTSKTDLAVFTASLRYCSIEVFEKETGRNIVRFLSDCLNPP